MGKTIIYKDLGPEKEIIETVCESNPLDPIAQVWATWKDLDANKASEVTIRVGFGLLREAISESMAINNKED